MTENGFELIRFNQFPSGAPGSELLLFAAPARALYAWAGIPRKGWRIRMLYQRGVAKARERQVVEFWNQAGTTNPPVLGPTAITLALQTQPSIRDGRLYLPTAQIIDPVLAPEAQLQFLAQQVLPTVAPRLTAAQRILVDEYVAKPRRGLPEVAHDYVFEFALQLAQMQSDAPWFIEQNEMSEDETAELVVALEAICRPALVVDGQHRLIGAAKSSHEIMIPCVAMPNAAWLQQIYQFIVINERAERVPPPVLTDIFGSSLTRSEQDELRKKLGRAGVDVESRVAAVIAGRDPTSPFYNMVRLKLEGGSGASSGFISDGTIRLLIDGRNRGSAGWRSDPDFYEYYVKPAFPEQSEWDNWNEGTWRDYWFAFWLEVREHYNSAAVDAGKDLLWSPDGLTNLTKGVTLRLFQRLFMEQAVARVKKVLDLREELSRALGAENAELHVGKRIAEVALSRDLDKFRDDVRTWFLDKGVPVRVFLREWVPSLDDSEGQEKLYKELQDAHSAAAEGRVYYARNKFVFEVSDKSGDSDEK